MRAKPLRRRRNNCITRKKTVGNKYSALKIISEDHTSESELVKNHCRSIIALESPDDRHDKRCKKSRPKIKNLNKRRETNPRNNEEVRQQQRQDRELNNESTEHAKQNGQSNDDKTAVMI